MRQISDDIMLMLKPYTCTMCGRHLHSFDKMKQHVRSHQLKYKISSSLKVFPHLSHLKRHINTHTKENLYQYHFEYTALPRQKEVMTISMFLRYGIKTKFCLIYPIFNKKFKIFDA